MNCWLRWAPGAWGRYIARDHRLGRDVALKVLTEAFARDPDRLVRFEREARAVAALAHPNIVVLHDFGTQDEVTFAVTELLEGETLRQRLDRSRLPWRKAVEIAAAVADGLAAAHSKGIIHRDIKPANIFLTADGRVKLLDFGVAHVQFDQVAPPVDTVVGTPARTDSGLILGTMGYMSPEQVRAQPVDGRSDIFALGCVLFEMLTGRRPFLRDTTADTMAAILTEELPDVSDTGERIPLEIDRVVRRCLEKNREERFQSARDLAFALREAASNTRSSSSEIVAVTPARRTPWRHRALLLLLAGGLVLIAGFVLLRYRSSHQPAPPAGPPVAEAAPAPAAAAIESVAVLPFVNATGDPSADYLSDGIADSLSHRLSQVHTLKVRPSSAVARFRGRDVDLMTAAKTLQVEAIVTGRFIRRGDEFTITVELVDARTNSQMWGSQYHGTLASIVSLPPELPVAIAERLRPGLGIDERRQLTRHFTEDPEANQLYLLGRYWWNKRTPQGLQKAIESFRKASAKDPNYALAYAGLADCYCVYSWFSEQRPLEVYRDARASALRALELDNTLAEAHTAMAYLSAASDWDWEAADRGFRRAIELNPNYATAHQWYGRFLSSLGRHAEAVREVRLAQKLDPSSLIINSNLTGALLYAGDLKGALEQGLATVQMDPQFPIGHIWLGDVYRRLGRLAEATAEYQRAAAIYPNQRLQATLAAC